MRPEPKTCRSCGRTIEWRKKWERDWDQVRYCSTSCRRRGVNDVDRRLEAALSELLSGRARGGRGVSPADAVRAVAGDDPDEQRALAEPARRAARRMVARGEAEIVQRGRVVDPSTASGPFEVRRPR
ncbi:DUF3253 domain-containing protein [Nocardioides zeae]|uniref:DUF3253 domain-containing protein n=1 Tax=Nocardioides imazamoxiresistens TaxID=3231893 RepID=A0ABU3PTT2_9ACTN|nr:DUF3253 domain-containing protein [Nocardioides zeae]MDT9592638.1 DUF3253 domain-containing protein [Nocardioides zeae]